MYIKLFKPLLDYLAAFILLVLSSPLLLVITILLLFANKGKIFFFQDRPGLNEKIFKLYKFKTMNDAVDKFGNYLPDSQRITRVGKIIRKLSLDELLQFLNVLKGDMSLIGPRPLLVEYLPLYNESQKKRHNVKPGITGWAQVNGRNAITWDERFKLDVFYVNNISFLLDLKIFILTFVKIFKREGVNTSSGDTMEKFRGDKKDA
ncbi:MAG TPA: sugar transferase [Melioribacteraceae bacterium]|nr:sugar transferase [Melioribacteraceae bacterium]